MSGDAVLTLNAGSSSFKFGLFSAEPEPWLNGLVSGIGGDALLKVKGPTGETLVERDLVDSKTHSHALKEALRVLPELRSFDSIVAVGHRIVFGGPNLDRPKRIDEELIAHLEAFVPFAPLHQPYNLGGVRAAMKAFPNAVQVGCFDTAFHRTQNWVRDTFALPRRYFDEGVRRYGFHGLSYQYIAGALAERYPELAKGRVVVAHLGNGASMCAMAAGKSVDSTMGFTALDGLPMGTRCGQIDPGVLLYLMDQQGMSVSEVTNLLYRESGLKGLSGVSNDMRELLASSSEDAAGAVSYFVSRIQRELGALTAVLGGLDAFVFTAGIGENSPKIRAMVCEGLAWLGIELDAKANQEGRERISTPGSDTAVLSVPTNEELVIARAAVSEVKGG